MISSFTRASALSTVFAVLLNVCIPYRATAEPTPDQDSMDKVGVAFASMIWLPRLDSACSLYKKGLISEEQLPEAYRILYQDLATGEQTPEAKRTFSKLMELLETGPEAMAAYLEASDSGAFQQGYFHGCPLPNKALGY